jgi:hypothetical protein
VEGQEYVQNILYGRRKHGGGLITHCFRSGIDCIMVVFMLQGQIMEGQKRMQGPYCGGVVCGGGTKGTCAPPPLPSPAPLVADLV